MKISASAVFVTVMTIVGLCLLSSGVMAQHATTDTLSSTNKDKVVIAISGPPGIAPTSEKMWTVVNATQPSMLIQPGPPVKQPHPLHADYGKLMGDKPVYTMANGPMPPRQASPPVSYDPTFGNFSPTPENQSNPFKSGFWHQVPCGIGANVFYLTDKYYNSIVHDDGTSMYNDFVVSELGRLLAKSDTSFKIICVPDEWFLTQHDENFLTSDDCKRIRGKIFDIIEQQKIPGVVFVTTGKQAAGGWFLERPSGQEAFEMLPLKTIQRYQDQQVQAALYNCHSHNTVGVLTIETATANPTVTWKTIDQTGRSTSEKPWSLGDSLGPGLLE